MGEWYFLPLMRDFYLIFIDKKNLMGPIEKENLCFISLFNNFQLDEIKKQEKKLNESRANYRIRKGRAILAH